MLTKKQILKTIEDLPQNTTVEEAMERLYLLYKVERGINQAEKGDKISQKEARQRMAHWFK